MLTEDQMQAMLRGLPDRATRSGLEPYRELVMAMRSRGYSYRQIARFLLESCDFKIGHSAIHEFVRKHGAEECDSATSGRTIGDHGRLDANQSIRDRIAAMKQQKAVPPSQESGFRFDPGQPLHLGSEPS